MCYVARDVYKVLRLHNTRVMLPDVPFDNIKTPVFTLRSVPGNITHHLLGMTEGGNYICLDPHSFHPFIFVVSLILQ